MAVPSSTMADKAFQSGNAVPADVIDLLVRFDINLHTVQHTALGDTCVGKPSSSSSSSSCTPHVQ